MTFTQLFANTPAVRQEQQVSQMMQISQSSLIPLHYYKKLALNTLTVPIAIFILI